MKVHPKYFLLFSDAFIPLLGFFVWNWSLYFILLFYLLDLLAREVLTHVKTHGIYKAQGLINTRKWKQKGALSGLLFLTVVAGVHVTIWWIQPEIHFTQELRNFWEYEELGVQQGYLLLPLIAYAAYAQYKMTFLLTGKAKRVLMDTLWKQHITALSLILAGTALTALVGSFVELPELAVVCAIVLFAGLYSLFLEKV